MQELLQHPAVQAGVVPFVVALLVGGVLFLRRAAWLAILVGYGGMLHLSTGITVFPMTVSRRAMLVVALAPVVAFAVDVLAQAASAGDGGDRSAGLRGAAADAVVPTGPRRWPRVLLLVLVAGASLWVFATLLAQREAGNAALQGVGIAAFAVAMTFAMLRLRDDGVATASAGLALGLAVGIAALLSASSGYFVAGVAVAAACGALLLLQFVTGRALAASHVGAATIAAAAALFSTATTMLAQLPWWALPLLLGVPLAAAAPFGQGRAVRARAVACTVAALAAGVLTPLAAWWSATAGQ